ncbi:MAG: helix-turn-helix transcriptional regulator [Rhodospirillales bacterium]|jgi:transcriptional regulator with XRE-family HTH domain
MKYADCYSSNLKRYLDGNQISTNSLANKSKISQKTIWVVQAGKSVPTVNTVQQISKALDIDGRVMLGKELTFDQLKKTKKIGKILDLLPDLSSDNLNSVLSICQAFVAK